MKNSIGLKYAQMGNNINDIKHFVNSFSLEEIKIFFSTVSGGRLGNRNKGKNTVCTNGGIPDIRRIYGAGLKVLSGMACSVHDKVKFYADIILNQVFKNGFKMYDKKDAILAYLCLIN